MLPVSDYTFKEARELAHGDFAYLEVDQSLAYVGSIPGGEPVVVLFNNWREDNLAYPEALNGFAVTLNNVIFEADLTSAVRCETHDPKAGTLVSRGDTLSVIGIGPRRQRVFIRFDKNGQNTEGPTIAFTRWQIVRKSGDEKVTLFEMNA
jgi:hypothetical protein